MRPRRDETREKIYIDIYKIYFTGGEWKIEFHEAKMRRKGGSTQ